MNTPKERLENKAIDDELRAEAEQEMKDSDQWRSGGDARCNYCDGPMPCDCEPPGDDTLDHDADAEARNRIDLPFEWFGV